VAVPLPHPLIVIAPTCVDVVEAYEGERFPVSLFLDKDQVHHQQALNHLLHLPPQRVVESLLAVSLEVHLLELVLHVGLKHLEVAVVPPLPLIDIIELFGQFTDLLVEFGVDVVAELLGLRKDLFLERGGLALESFLVGLLVLVDLCRGGLVVGLVLLPLARLELLVLFEISVYSDELAPELPNLLH